MNETENEFYLGLCKILDEKFGSNWKWETSFRYKEDGSKYPVGVLWAKKDEQEYVNITPFKDYTNSFSFSQENDALYECVFWILQQLAYKEN